MRRPVLTVVCLAMLLISVPSIGATAKKCPQKLAPPKGYNLPGDEESIYLAGYNLTQADGSYELMLHDKKLSQASASGFADSHSQLRRGEAFEHQGTFYFLLRQFSDYGLRIVRSSSGAVLESPYVRFHLKSIASGKSYFPDYYDMRKVELKVDLAEIPDDVIGYFPPQPLLKEKKASRFQMGKRNSNVAIRDLFEKNGTLNNIPISKIERKLNPGEAIPVDYTDRVGFRDYSTYGFKGAEESLEELMIEQNDLVLKKLKLTHQELVEPLLKIETALRNGFIDNGQAFRFKGGSYSVRESSGGMGNLYSPFGDGSATRTTYLITNLKTKKELRVSSLSAEMVYRYGFYQSAKSNHYFDPNEIVGIFPFLKRK